ncbi:MAG: hypothetical protein CL843_14750 [Crocinitomicaceae bacterium]|nr:hypothetical protein [Crocinitomicaceae bacterium]|tara:strand:+ start:5022 stop:5423 length:402 start_codon:yes stop_codon:yes gene_type:complete
MGNFIIPLIALVGSMLFSRSINERGMKLLNDNEKGRLVDLFKDQRRYGMYAIVVIIGLYLVVVNFNLLPPLVYMSLYVVIIVGFIAFQGIQARKVLRKNDYPEEYIKAYTHSTIFRGMGVVLFVILLVTGGGV